MSQGSDRIVHNDDGSSIFRLNDPCKVDGEEITRVTIPAITGKLLRKCPFEINSPSMTLGVLVSFSADIVKPPGAVDGMSARDAIAIAGALAEKLGKSQATTEPVSP